MQLAVAAAGGAPPFVVGATKFALAVGGRAGTPAAGEGGGPPPFSPLAWVAAVPVGVAAAATTAVATAAATAASGTTGAAPAAGSAFTSSWLQPNDVYRIRGTPLETQ